jgi:hypothetical protein
MSTGKKAYTPPKLTRLDAGDPRVWSMLDDALGAPRATEPCSRYGCRVLLPVPAVFADTTRQVLLLPPGTICRDCGAVRREHT